MSQWRRWRWALQLLGPALLVWVLYSIDVSAMVEEVGRANWALVFLSMSLGLPFILMKSERWRVMLRLTGSRTSSIVAFRLFSIGHLAGVATPGQIGEFIKVLGVRQHGGTLKSGIISSLGDRSIDFVVLLGLAGYYALILGDAPALESTYLLVGAMAIVAVVSGWLLLVIAEATTDTALRPASIVGIVRNLKLRVPWRPVLVLASLTVAAYFLFGVRYYLLLEAMDFSAPTAAFISSMGVVALVALLPISVAGVGSRDAALVLIFDRFDIPSEGAVGFSFLVLTLYIFTAAVGAVVLWTGFGRIEEHSH